MNKRGRHNNLVEVIFALIIGFLIVISVPELKSYFDMLVGAIFTGVILGIIIGAIIFVVWFIMNRK